jgi:hypothetical protein
MKVAMPKKDVEISIGAAISGTCLQARTTTDRLRDPDQLVCDRVQMLGGPPALAGRFKLDDTRPWKQGEP